MMESCFSAKQQSLKEENPSPHFPILPFSFPISPLLGQPSSSNRSLPLLLETSNAVRLVRESILSNFEKCLEILDEYRSPNGILDKFVFVASHLHNGCQRREWQNLAMLPNSNFAAILPGDSLAAAVVANGFLNFLNIYNSLLVARLILTWFPNAPPAVVSPLSTICDPYLNIFRGIIPPLGGSLDLSPVLAFLLLNAFTSTASALPAELPTAEASNGPPPTTSHLTASRRRGSPETSRDLPIANSKDGIKLAVSLSF